jgi:hypothetical protein
VAKPDKKPSGGQTKFDPEIAEEICEIVSRGKTLTKACEAVGVPKTTFTDWVMADRGGLSVRYARAREMMIEHIADEIIDLTDDTSKDRTNIPVNRNRLQVDSRKWLLSKLRPEKYGDSIKVDQRTTLVSVKDTPEELAIEKESWEQGHKPNTHH